MRFFILGNGFDKAHNLPTNYCQFRAWLIVNYNVIIDEEIELPEYRTNYKRLESFDEEKFASFFIHLLDDAEEDSKDASCQNEKCPYYEDCIDKSSVKWCDFEENLAKLRWELGLHSDDKFYDSEGHLDISQTDDNFSIRAQMCSESNHILRQFFREWIIYINNIAFRNCDVSSKPCFKDVFKKDDKYLTFNYTNTLEILYGIKNVCHIHGDISQWEELVFGHSNPGYPTKDWKIYEYNAYCQFNKIYESYIKDTQKQILRHAEFFDDVKNVEEIYLYGLSFGNADLPYFQHIFKKCQHLKTIYLYVYNPDEYEEKVEKLKSCGANCAVKKWE